MRFSLTRRLVGVLAAFVVLIVLGTGGYMILEGWQWREALFMTVITLSTVGYGEVKPLGPNGEVFSMVLILLGVGGAAYTFSAVTDYIIAGELRGALRRQRMLKAISRLEGHYIICGYGRVGQQVVEGLLANRFDVVVIDAEDSYVDDLEHKGVNYIVGDASDDAILSQAGIERAAGLCMCLPNDATNVFTILSARTLNPNLYIVSRSNQQESERKLRIAGANQVINPYLITGHRMAAQLLHPGVVEFLDVVMRQGELELRIEEIVIGSDSNMHGRTMADCNVRGDTGVNVLAVRRAEGRLFTNLDAKFVLRAGDALIALGTVPQLAALAKRAGDQRHWLRAAAD